MCQMPNIWHIKLQNMSFIRWFICVIFLKHATVRSQIWERTVYLFHNLYYFFILAGPTSSVSSFLHQIVSALSLTSFLCSLSLFHVTASLSDETQAGASSHATPHEPDLHSQIVVHQHSHTNPTHHIHNNPWPDHHATPRRRACRAIHHVIGTSHHRMSLNWPAVVGFAFGFVWFGMWVCLIWLCFLPCQSLWLCLIWVLLLGLFDLPCRSLWFFFYLFFFKVALVDVGLCRWWLSVLLR